MNASSSFATVDSAEVLSALRAAGSRDPDVLDAARRALMARARTTAVTGTVLVLAGAALALTGFRFALLAFPLIGIGWWVRRRGIRNAATIRTVFEQFVRSPGS
jgi:hypothetical protein